MTIRTLQHTHAWSRCDCMYVAEETCLTWNNFLCVFQPGDGCTILQSEINNSLTSGQATVKRDLVLAPGRPGEAVCPLNALLQSQQPHANSLSLVCRRLCSVAWLPVRLAATQHTPCWRQRPLLHTLVSLARLSICQSKYAKWYAEQSNAQQTWVNSFKPNAELIHEHFLCQLHLML